MHIYESIRQSMFVPIHPAGWPFIAIFALVGLLLTLVWDVLFTPGLLLTLWCVYFFRNPVRTTPDDAEAVIAPADGKIIGVDELPPPSELELPEGKYIRIAIFMNVFDVHVNRAPMSGVITDKFYFPGVFVNASLDKAATDNERLGLVMKTDHGPSIGFIQIAGLWPGGLSVMRWKVTSSLPGNIMASSALAAVLMSGCRSHASRWCWSVSAVSPVKRCWRGLAGRQGNHFWDSAIMTDGDDDMPVKSGRPVRNVGLAWMLPNLLTISALLCGMSAIRFAFQERWEAAVLMVAVAGVLDALDGRMARILKVSSNFGAQLDSLSDMVVFGVVPSIMLYLWVLEDGGRIAWTACMFYTACCGLRLARFNSELHETPKWAANYFVGVPSPAAAFLALVPLVASFKFDWPMLQSWPEVALWLALVGTGAISTIPTFAGKKMRLPRSAVLPMMAVFAMIVAILVARPWETWVVLALAYISLIPVSMVRFASIRKAQTHS